MARERERSGKMCAFDVLPFIDNMSAGSIYRQIKVNIIALLAYKNAEFECWFFTSNFAVMPTARATKRTAAVCVLSLLNDNYTCRANVAAIFA